MFRDECRIKVLAGKGGDGLSSFRREKYAPKGGPDGGDGGNGGSVVLHATGDETSFLKLARKPRYQARKGQPGGPRNRSGGCGEDLVIDVPIGTMVYDLERGNLLRDLTEEGERLVIAAGGRGGRGNASFASSVRQSPRETEPGKPGEIRDVRLELKLFAEVGLIGLPNAGKSTFLSSISQAKPKIADYPFTTLAPQVGIAAVGDFDSLVVADLPGLIEGAAEGAGLGHRFLKHVERCRVLLHLVDVSPAASDDPIRAHEVILGELERYEADLQGRPRLLVATKVEDEESRARAEELGRSTALEVFPISSVSGEGVEALLFAAQALVRAGSDRPCKP